MKNEKIYSIPAKLGPSLQNTIIIFVMVFSCLEVGVLFSWLWVKRCDVAGIKKLGWYSVGREGPSLTGIE